MVTEYGNICIIRLYNNYIFIPTKSIHVSNMHNPLYNPGLAKLTSGNIYIRDNSRTLQSEARNSICSEWVTA